MASDLLPYFKFFPRDWLTSPTVMLMSLEEEAAYLRMLCLQWEHGHVEVRHLRGMLRFSQERIDELLAGPVGECFERTDDGHLINRRLEGERARACSIIENRRQAGRARHKPSTNSAPAKQAQSKGTGKRRNAEHELAEAVRDWERINGAMPDRLRHAVTDFLASRKAQRRSLWGREMWLRNMDNSHTPDEWAEAYETATRCGWHSVHPKKAGGGVRPGTAMPAGNQFANLLEEERES